MDVFRNRFCHEAPWCRYTCSASKCVEHSFKRPLYTLPISLVEAEGDVAQRSGARGTERRYSTSSQERQLNVASDISSQYQCGTATRESRLDAGEFNGGGCGQGRESAHEVALAAELNGLPIPIQEPIGGSQLKEMEIWGNAGEGPHRVGGDTYGPIQERNVPIAVELRRLDQRPQVGLVVGSFDRLREAL